MRLIVFLAVCGLAQVIYAQDRCGAQIQKMETCIQLNMNPDTSALKRGLTSCFRPRRGNGCLKTPRLKFIEDRDGNAVTECLNQGLKVKGGPVIERCMRRKFRGWQYPIPPGTFVPGSPEAIIRVALNQLEDPKICPPNKQKSVQTCMGKVIQKTVPTPSAAEAKRIICAAKAKCKRGMSKSCLRSVPSRSLLECKCAGGLSKRYMPAADQVTKRCLLEYMDNNQANQFISEMQKARPKGQPECKAPPPDDC